MSVTGDDRALDDEGMNRDDLGRLIEAGTPAQPAVGRERNMAGRGEKRGVVMVVEDDPILSSMACEMVEECGLEAFTSDTGDAAYAYLEDHAAEVASVFVDIGLRDSIDGIALAITTAADHPHIRICVTSGQSTARPPDLPLSVKYLPKPWRALEVLDFVLPD